MFAFRFPPVSRLARVVLAGAAISLLMFALPVTAQDNGHQNEFKNNDVSLSLGASKKADPKEVGLPVYSGARPHRDEPKDDPAAKIWAWSNSAGFEIVVLKFESDDSPDKIAAFYRKALGKYGPVLDCSAQSETAKAGEAKPHSQLSCDDAHPKPGEVQFKAGSKHEQHLVGIQPYGKGSLFQLIHVKSSESVD